MSYTLFLSTDGADAGLLKILLAARTSHTELKIQPRKRAELKDVEKATNIPVSLARHHVMVIEPMKRYLFETNAIIR
jgi:hypothetical protein